MSFISCIFFTIIIPVLFSSHKNTYTLKRKSGYRVATGMTSNPNQNNQELNTIELKPAISAPKFVNGQV